MTERSALDTSLIFRLSLFGLVMALATVWLIPSSSEPLFWLAIFGTCAFLIARNAPGRHFLHGFLVSLANCVWITSAHVIFYRPYLDRHPEEAAGLAQMPLPDAPRLMMLMTGPVVGVVSGLVLGGLAFGASKLVKRAAATS